MKQLFFRRLKNSLLISTLIIACIASSQIAKAQYNVIKVDVMALIIPEMPVFRPCYERNFGKYISMAINFETGKYSVGTSNFGQAYSLRGWGLMYEFRVYPFGERKDAPIGFYFGTHLRYRSMHESYVGKDYSLPSSTNSGNSSQPGIAISIDGSLVDIGLHGAYKGKAGAFIFEPLIGFGKGFVSGFPPNERARMDPFYADPIDSVWNLLRLQFSIGFVFPEIK